MMNNGRPLTKKQQVRVMVALTILAWATQTLFKQWGYGAQLPATQPSRGDELAERFVPVTTLYPRGVTLEVRSNATVIGGEVKLRQICRWSDRDKGLFDPIGDLILVRLAPDTPFKAVSVDEIRGLLRDAGVNIAAINFAGSVNCTVARSDVHYDEREALQKWIESNDTAKTLAEGPTSAPHVTVAAAPATVPTENGPVRTLREMLVADLAVRLNLPPESLQVDFKPQDQNALNIATPLFQFEIEPLRARSLGQVIWNVKVLAPKGQQSRKLTIAADSRAWQEQVVTAKPLTFKQIIRADDLVRRRTLVDQLTDDPLLAMDQIVGQQAARELKPGSIMTAKTVDAVQLVKAGQFVTVSLDQGSVKIKTVAKAMENGVYGQTIRVKNETTRDVFQVVMTGPQQATMSAGTAPMASVPTQE